MSAALALFGVLSALTLDEAIEHARAQHPDVDAAAGVRLGAEARARQTRAALLPQLNATARYNLQRRSTLASMQSPGGAYTAALDANVLVYDFGRSWDSWQAARASAAAAGADEAFSELTVITTVRLAFIDALELDQLVRVAHETLVNQERHHSQISELVAVGLRPPIDRAQATTQVASAKATLIRAENDLLAGKARLRQAMGWPDAADFELEAPKLGALVVETEAVGQLYAIAVAERPDLESARKTLEAREETIDATKARFFPALRFGVTGGFLGDDLFDPGWSVAAGLSLSWSLFDGLGVYAATDAAEADARVQHAQKAGLEQGIQSELEAARIGVVSAKAELEAQRQAESSAQDFLHLAEERYANGLGSALELADAQLARTNAEVARIRVEYDLAAARAQLLHSLGRKSWN